MKLSSRWRASAVAIASFTYVFAMVTPTQAATLRDLLWHKCANAAEVRAAAVAADESDAMGDDDRYAKSREAARQFYRCSNSANDPYLHDIAKLFYTSYLITSLRTDGEIAQTGPVVVGSLNDLLQSPFPDVIKHATAMRNRFMPTYDAVKRELNPGRNRR